MVIKKGGVGLIKDDKRDIEHEFKKKVELLETKLKDVNEIHAMERREFKTKIKKSNKKLKDATEKEAKLEVEKVKFEKLKEAHSSGVANHSPYYTSDITSYPSMVAHWLPPPPPKRTFSEWMQWVHQTLVQMQKTSEKTRKLLHQ